MRYLLFIALLSCSSHEKEDLRQYYTNSYGIAMSEILYYKDIRTDTCFAALGLSSTTQTITKVDCNQQVEDGIINFRSTPIKYEKSNE